MAVSKKTEADDTVVGDEATTDVPVEDTGNVIENDSDQDVEAEKTAEKLDFAREAVHEIAEEITTDGVPVARAEKAMLLEAVTKPTETIGDYPMQSAEEVQHRFNHRIYADYTPPPFPSPQV